MKDILIILIEYILVYVLGYAIGVGKTIKTIRQAFKYERLYLREVSRCN